MSITGHPKKQAAPARDHTSLRTCDSPGLCWLLMAFGGEVGASVCGGDDAGGGGSGGDGWLQHEFIGW